MANKKLRLVLGDQLNYKHSWWKDDPDSFNVILIESKSETGYVTHHIQKVIAFFLSMRNFGAWLEEKGITVKYIKLDSHINAGSISQNVARELDKFQYNGFEYQEPDEYRLDRELKKFSDGLDIDVKMCSSEHFLTGRKDLGKFFEGKKTFLMESFYRMMRKKFDILMDGDNPRDGKWNFDKENRKSLPAGHKEPAPKVFRKNVSEVVALLKKEGVKTMGRVDESDFIWPTSREESLENLRHFIKNLLANFGDFQDAMLKDQWTLYHSRLSFSMNSKMLSPLEVVEKVEKAFLENPDDYPIAAVEGFIRQIIGWREYMRGVYWAKMPGYADKNYFSHSRKLPEWYWTGETKMQCMSQAVNQSLDYAYAHHIQRLMITGNFALLAGIHPDEVDAWYLGIYIDAIEWVEITNTRGMSQFADGGIVGTKPYVSSANYIDKMSDYCKGCAYSKSKKTGEGACPFNSLFWDFYHRHRDKLENN
ncbi:MAG TPA: cryptochrome/photolyase family protein, partial [Cryomorphaceae bacterium]|nr:cryptochrome/photolyase family protein [Cryomorphaceae bacterium]